MRRRFTRTGNRIAVGLYRKLDGRLSSGRRDVSVLLITVPGRRTGLARSTCVRFLQTPDGPVVWGTGSGSTRDPDWFRNLRAADVAEVQKAASGSGSAPGNSAGLPETPCGPTPSSPTRPRLPDMPAKRAGPSQLQSSIPSTGSATDRTTRCPPRHRAPPLRTPTSRLAPSAAVRLGASSPLTEPVDRPAPFSRVCTAPVCMPPTRRKLGTSGSRECPRRP